MKTLRFLPAVLGVLSMAVPEGHAQTIPNPGFEADHFTVGPGYVGSNGGVISGWTFTGLAGLNPANGSPFANNGAVPQGNNVAFLQGLSSLSTTVTGLTPATVYILSFRANMRLGYSAPAPEWSVNGTGAVPFSATPEVGGSNGYYHISRTFIAASADAALVISNTNANDTTLLVDDFSITPVTSSWVVSPWTGDATSGMGSCTLGTYRFGSAINTFINGTPVLGVDGADPSFAGQFAVAGVPFVYTGDDNNLTTLNGTGSQEMAKHFVYGGTPAVITIQGLTPGQTYVVSLLSVGWDAARPRIVTFSSAGHQCVVDQNQFGDNNGLRVDYTFVAAAASRTITITPQDNGFTFHLYGLTLRQPALVTNTADSGYGSLRYRLANPSCPGPNLIAFDPALSGQTIKLLNEITVSDAAGFTVDASTLPGAATVRGSPGTNHLFNVTSGTILTLRGLTLTGGNAVAAASNFWGGAINNDGTLTLTHCTLSGNSAGGWGGAILNAGTLTLTHCSLFSNSAVYGGAIFNTGGMTLTHCTLSGNSSGSYGGAIACTNSRVSLTHCTLSGNSALELGGAVYLGGPFIVGTLNNTIVAGNTAPAGKGADIYNYNGVVTRAGANIIQSFANAGTGSDSGPGALTGDPLLALPGDYGGPVQTMALRPGSPARNAAPGSAITADQRGFPLVGVPDIGAYEAGTLSNCAAALAETLPATGPSALVAAEADFDGDGATNEQEWNALTDPANPASVLRILALVRSGGNALITFPTVSGRNYTLYRSDTLTGAWINTGLAAVTGNGSNQSFPVPVSIPGVNHRFYRVMASP